MLRPGSRPASDGGSAVLQPLDSVAGRWENALIPIVAVVFVALAGLYQTGAAGLEPGARAMTAVALGEVTQVVGTGVFLASLLEQTLPVALLPGLVFLIAAITAFSTGTSWGTMAILFPVVIPLAVAMGAGVGFAGGEHYQPRL